MSGELTTNTDPASESGDAVIAALEAHDAAIAAMDANMTRETVKAATDAWASLEAMARDAGWREGEVGYLVPYEQLKEFALRRKVTALQERVRELEGKQ